MTAAPRAALDVVMTLPRAATRRFLTSVIAAVLAARTASPSGGAAHPPSRRCPTGRTRLDSSDSRSPKHRLTEGDERESAPRAFEHHRLVDHRQLMAGGGLPTRMRAAALLARLVSDLSPACRLPRSSRHG